MDNEIHYHPSLAALGACALNHSQKTGMILLTVVLTMQEIVVLSATMVMKITCLHYAKKHHLHLTSFSDLF